MSIRYTYLYCNFRLWLFLVIGLLCGGSSMAADNGSYEALRPALALFKIGNYVAAAENWLAVAADIQKHASRHDVKALRKAGLACVAATIAFGKAGDERGYESWAQAIQYYLKGRTQWEEERRKLRLRLKDITYALKVAPAGLGKLPISGDELLLLELEQELSLTKFTGPRPGLLKERVKEDKPEIIIAHDYYARPLKVIEEERKEGQSRSKYAVDKEDAIRSSRKAIIPAGVGSRASVMMAAPLVIKGIDDVKPEPGQPLPGNSTGAKASTGTEVLEKPTITQSTTVDRAILLQAPVSYTAHASRLPVSPIPIRGTMGDTVSHMDQYKEIARRAWRYFETNEQSNTGLFNGSNGYSNATVWDMASGLAALIAAEQLGLVDQNKFGKLVTQQLQTLQQIPLYNDVLPNREYNIQTGKMLDLRNRSSNQGSGWSAVDIGRFLIWLHLLKEWYPEFAEQVDKVVGRWDLSQAVNSGELQGALFDGSQERRFQEGRLGYEHYAAIGFLLWGIDVRFAMDLDNVAFVDLYGVKVPYDKRDHSYLTTDPFVLLSLEAGGMDERFRELIQSVYQVQKKRWQEEYILTARGESRLSQAPWFVYNTIYANQKPWNTVSYNGRSYPDFSGGSTMIAFAWSVLLPKDDYIDQLLAHVIDEFHPKFGYYSGFFESGELNTSLEINTNALILEALLYVKRNQKPFITVTASSP